MATNSGLTFSDDGVLEVTLRPGEGVPDTATVMGGWAVDESGKGYIEAASVVPDTAVQTGGLSYTQDGALYVTSATPSNPVYIGGRAVRQDGALHVKTGTPSGDDQALGGWMTSNAGQAYVDVLPSFWLPLTDLGGGEADVTLGMGTGAATFTRATTATTVDSTGTIVSVASGVPRSYYDPTTLEYRGYLAEGARTNLLLRSEEFDNASWIKTDTTVTANSITSPDGATTADLLTSGTAGTAVTVQGVVATADANYALSVFLKRGNNDWIRLQFANGANGVRAWVNLATGAVGTTTAFGTGASVSTTIKEYPNGWYRFSIVGSVGSGATAISCFLSAVTADASNSAANSATYYPWGAQFENNVSFPSTYIPTTTASVIRNADVLTYTFAGNADATVGSVYAEAALLFGGTAPASEQMVGFVSGGNGLLMLSGQAATTITVNDGTTSVTKTGLTSLATATRKSAASWGAGGLLATRDGATVASGAFDGNMGSTAIGIGSDTSGARNLFGTIKNARIFQVQFSAAQLQAITA